MKYAISLLAAAMLAAGAEADMARNYLKAAAHLAALEARTGAHVALAIEPEPFCFLETIAESVAFFRDHLFSDPAVAELARLTGFDIETLIICFAPGGVTEMALVALSLQANPAVVTLHHIYRIILTIIGLVASAGWLRQRL